MTNEPAERQLEQLLDQIIAMEPVFRDVPGWRLRQLARAMHDAAERADERADRLEAGEADERGRR